MKKISPKEKEKIISLIKLFPAKISVTIHRSEDGGFWAEINDLDGCATQGETLSELLEMINDCVYTYFDVPKKYLSFMPSYLPSVDLARKFNIFPLASELNHQTIQFVK